MAGNSYYLRLRGRVTGPFDLPTLQKLARRGAVSRVHELSRDQVAWTLAGNVEGLFPSAADATPVPTPAAVATSSATPALPLLTAGVSGAVASKASGVIAPRYFYRQGGTTIGPVPLAILRSLAASGKLDRTALVWTSTIDTALPAEQWAELQFPVDKSEIAPRRRNSRTLVVGLAAVCLILLLGAALVAWTYWMHRHPGGAAPSPMVPSPRSLPAAATRPSSR